MSEYRSNTTIPDMARRILAAKRTLITTHAKPDGDAMGSTLALQRALTHKGSAADLWLIGPVESSLRTIANPTPFRLVEQQVPDDRYDLVIVTDTGAWSQLEPMATWLRPRYEMTVGIDHHSHGDNVASMRLIDPKAVSTTALLVPLLDAMQCELSGGVGGVAEALFVGLATDSGWFRYGNAGAEAFALAARLLARGVNKDRLYQILEETFGPQRLALEARALASLEYAGQARAFAIQMLRPQDFIATGANQEDLTGLVNDPMTVGSVRASILLAEFPDKPAVTKMSFRSKPAAPGGNPGEYIDVNALAQQFGGGGHVHAAGARVNMPIDEAKAAVIKAISGGA